MRVNVDVSAAGHGTVSVTLDLDRSAADAVGQLQLSDLEQAGWRVAGPHPTPGGGLTVTASTTAAAMSRPLSKVRPVAARVPR